MKISIIAAVAENYAIGKDNDLIWHLPKDMKFFMDTTMNHHVLMGRKNYLSIPEKYRPFKNRTNIVITRQQNYKAPKCHVFNSIEEGVKYAKNNNEHELFIIGGGEIYKQALEMDIVDTMYITWINESFEAHTFFPQFEESSWDKEHLFYQEIDEKHAQSFQVYKYSKK